MNGQAASVEQGFVERLQALDRETILAFLEGMTPIELLAYVIFTAFTIAFFVWVAYLAIRR